MNEQDAIIKATQCWVEQWVIQENLCPFAAKPASENRLLYQVSRAERPKQLLQDLTQAVTYLVDTPPEFVETTLLIHPYVLQDFLAYNDFLDEAEEQVFVLGYEGIIQIASFHPHYQFSDTEYDDVDNFTNRSPYPMLHLIRESSIEQATLYHPNIEAIPERNIEHVRQLGATYIQQLLQRCTHR